MPDDNSFSSSSKTSSYVKLTSNLELGSLFLVKRFMTWPTTRKAQHVLKHDSTFQDGSSKPSAWKPSSLSFTVLTIFITSIVGLGAFLAILQWKNDRNGGLFFAEQISDLPASSTFLYLYLPTILAVSYSTGWSWIDLDVKRLEPWFQLSRQGGTTGGSSLLLQYPIEFLAFVPFRAAKKRQWAVVIASTVMMTFFWAVTPLQSGIFNTQIVTTSEHVPVQLSSGFLDPSEQTRMLSTSFLNTGYGISWLDQPLPPFTSKEFALAPFRTANDSVMDGNTTLTTKTVLYGTELNCYPPSAIRYDSAINLSFDNGKGCNAQDLLQTSATPREDFVANYVGYWDSGNVDTSLQAVGCPLNASHTFLAVWRKSANNIYKPDFHNASNATALFCETNYYSQEVQATVKLPEYAIVETFPTKPKQQLPKEIFNSTLFEYILNAGLTHDAIFRTAGSQLNAEVPGDIADTTVIHQDGQLSNMSLLLPTSNMVGFAIGLSRLAPEEYLDPKNIENAFQAAHKLLFALAAGSVMEPVNDKSPPSIGLREHRSEAIVMVKIFTILVEGFLAFVVLLTFYLVHHYARSHTNLAQDPNSILEIMRLSKDQGILNLFSSLDRVDDHKLKSLIGPIDFCLNRKDPNSSPSLQVMHPAEQSGVWPQFSPTSDANNTLGPSQEGTSIPRPSTSETNCQRPLVLSWLVGAIVLLLLAAAVALITTLRYRIRAQNGLSLPSQSAISQQILLSYIPTTFATLLEPFLLLLNRWMCILEPFESLRKGVSPVHKSVGTQYTSLPPQLAIWQAIRARHILLAALSITTILANVLTISLSGLFFISDTTRHQNVFLRPTLEPRFQAGLVSEWEVDYTQSDPLIIAKANITTETRLPSWTTPEYYFLPMDLPATNVSGRMATEYEVDTIGFGVDANCGEMTQSASNHSYEFKISHDATRAAFSTTHLLEDGSVVRCFPNSTTMDLPTNYTALGRPLISLDGLVYGTQALEVVSPMRSASNETSQIQFCSNLFVAGWIRANILWSNDYSVTANGKLMNATSISTNMTFVGCQPKLKTGVFRLSVDNSGKVLRAPQIGSTKPGTGEDVDSLLITLTTTSMSIREGGVGPIWHNNTFAVDWTNYLLKGLMKSDAITNPYETVPETGTIVKALGDLYQRMFAIRLGLKSHGFAPSSNSSSVPAIESWNERGVFMSETMFKIAISILVWDIMILLLLYVRTPPAFLPRLPISIASILAYVAASQAVADLNNTESESEIEGSQRTVSTDERYGFGKFVGTDGKTHTGIERTPFVCVGRDERHVDKFGLRRRRPSVPTLDDSAV